MLKTTDEGPLRCPELSNTEVKFSDDEDVTDRIQDESGPARGVTPANFG